jgi:hypothetical protein
LIAFAAGSFDIFVESNLFNQESLMVAGFKSNLLVNETKTWADAINIKAELEAIKPFAILMNKLERLSLLAPFFTEARMGTYADSGACLYTLD